MNFFRKREVIDIGKICGLRDQKILMIFSSKSEISINFMTILLCVIILYSNFEKAGLG